MKKIARWLMDFIFIGLPVCAWIGCPIAAYVFRWGSGSWIVGPGDPWYGHWTLTHTAGIYGMGLAWGIPTAIGLIWGLVRLWDWSHARPEDSDTGEGEPSCNGGHGFWQA